MRSGDATVRRATRSEAPPEEVWKLLYDPARFPEWWMGIETVEQTPEEHATGVTISCLVSDLHFEWSLQPLDGGQVAVISVHVEVPEQEAHRLEIQQEVIRRSVTKLAELAAEAQRRA